MRLRRIRSWSCRRGAHRFTLRVCSSCRSWWPGSGPAGRQRARLRQAEYAVNVEGIMPRGFRHGPLESLVLSQDYQSGQKGRHLQGEALQMGLSAPVLEQVDTVGLGCISGV